MRNLPILRLQAEAFRRHGITRDTFLKLTPSELAILNKDALQEWKTDKELADRRTARIIAAIYNNNPNRKKGRVFGENDFLPKKKSEAQNNQTAANLLAKAQFLQNLFSSLEDAKET